jgi:hypothetical protein
VKKVFEIFLKGKVWIIESWVWTCNASQRRKQKLVKNILNTTFLEKSMNLHCNRQFWGYCKTSIISFHLIKTSNLCKKNYFYLTVRHNVRD